MNYFSAKISCLTPKDNGELKSTKEEYLINAFSFSEAEANLQKKLDGRKYELLALTIKNFDEIYKVQFETLDDLYYYKVIIKHTTVNEAGKEVKTKSVCLIEAKNTDEANEKIVELWKNSGSDWSIFAISETNYLDLFV